MKQSILHTAIWIGSFLFATLSLDAQSPIKEVRAGNEAFKAGEHKKALEHYQKALDKGMKDPRLRFNKGDALYRLEKYADAARTFQRIARNTQNEDLRAKAFHNKGNAHLKAGKLEKSIEAYKEALRIDPSDEDTRYNLALAKKLKEKAQKKKKNKKQKKKQQKDQKQKGGKQQKEKKKKGQEKKKGKKQQEGKQNRKEQQKEGKKGQRGKEDRKKKEGKKAGKGEQQKGEKDKKRKARALSPEEVEQLLKAMEKKEGKVQQKVLRKMRKKKEKEGEGSDDEKDW